MLHEHGSGNPNGITGNGDRYPMHPYFSFKDLVTVFLFLLALSIIVCFYPNLLGHSDNYIPANPMQTPASIKEIVNLLSEYLLALSTAPVKPYSDAEANDYDEGKVDNYSSNTTGTVIENGFLVSMSKSQVLDLLNKATNNTITFNKVNFQSLVNGIFQAEGHWGGYFTSLNTVNYRPLWFIGQIACTESIQFFGQINQIFEGQLVYYLQVLPSGQWFIRIQCRDWNYIINNIMPYFNQLYAEKYTGMLKLARIYDLMPVNSVKAKVELISLAYSLTSSGFRTIPLLTKIKAVTALIRSDIEIPSLNGYSSNETPFNLIWILGFMLGDGNIYVRIRDTKVGLEFVPLFRITQKNTAVNLSLYTKLVDFISSLPGKLSPIIKKQGDNLELHVFGKANVTSLMNMLAPYSHFFYWKRGQFSMLTRVLALLNLNIKNWLGLQKTILAIIFEIPGNRVYSITH